MHSKTITVDDFRGVSISSVLSKVLEQTVTKSLQYVIKSCFSKLFQTRSDDVITECMNMFNCLPVADAVSRRKRNFFCHGSALSLIHI